MFRAILDSALVYESVKPIIRELRIVNDLQNKEVELLKRERQLLQIAYETERKARGADIEKSRKTAFRRGFLLGLCAEFGILVTAAALTP